jgi:glycine cleavage system aminomethyltransferase T
MYNHEETEMKALLIDVMENKVETVDVNGLEDYYKLIHCTTIDIVNREIKGKRYDIICDDEGTFSDDPLISAIDDLGRAMLVGNLIVCGEADEEGNLTALTDDDIKHIKENIQSMGTSRHPEGHGMICQMEY